MREPNIYLCARILCICLFPQLSNLNADDLVITPEQPLEPPVLASNAIFRPYSSLPNFLQLGSFDSNSLLVWNWWIGNGGASNLIMGARLSADGTLLDKTGFQIARNSRQPIIAVGNQVSWIIRDEGHSGSLPYQGKWMCNRVTSSGQVLDGSGVLISTSDPNPRVASNGTNLFALFGNDAVIMEASGKVSTKRNPFSPLPNFPEFQGSYLLGYESNYVFATTFADLIYLQICSAKGDILTRYRLETSNALYSPMMASKSGQLLVAWQQLPPTNAVVTLQIRQFYDFLHPPEELPELNLPATARNFRFFPTSDGWVLFYSDQTSTKNFQFSSLSTNWIPSVWPELSPGSLISSPHLDLFLAASIENDQIHTRKLTAQALSSPDQVQFHNQQNGASVVHADSTYLVYWQDTRQTNALYALRFANDGSRLDGHAFPIATKVVLPSVAGANGRFFALWFAASPTPGGAGVPQKYSLWGAFLSERDTNVQLEPFQIAKDIVSPTATKPLFYLGSTYAAWRAPTQWSFAKIADQGIVPLPDQVAAETLETNGKELLLLSVKKGPEAQAQTAVLEPRLKLGPLLDLGPGSAASSGIAANDFGFLIAWRTFRETTIRYARIRDGQILDPPVSPKFIIPPFNGHLEVAANATDFLVVASQNDPAFSFTAWMLIKESGETLSSLSPGASYSPKSATGINRDFFVVQSTILTDTVSAAAQWVLTDPQPIFTSSIDADGKISHRLFQLAPHRGYRIETSPDLTTWSPLTTISDQPGFQFETQPLHPKEFYRAVLLLD